MNSSTTKENFTFGTYDWKLETEMCMSLVSKVDAGKGQDLREKKFKKKLSRFRGLKYLQKMCLTSHPHRVHVNSGLSYESSFRKRVAHGTVLLQIKISN